MGLSLSDLGGRLTFYRLAAIMRHSRPGSAIYEALHGDESMWASGYQSASILADIFDTVQALRSEFAAAHGVENVPRPYPRPWDKAPESDDMTREEFDEWMREVARGV